MLVGADAAADGEHLAVGRLQRAQRLHAQALDDGLLHGAGDIRAQRVIQDPVAHRVQHRGLEPGKTELQSRAVQHRPRKLEGAGAALRGDPRQLRATRVGQAQELRGLVEGLPGRIVAGLPEQPVGADALDLDQHGCGRRRPAARHAEKAAAQAPAAAPADAPPDDGRPAPAPPRRRPGSGARAAPVSSAPDQAGAGGIGDAIQLAGRGPGGAQHLAQQRQQPLDMVAGGQFRHHPAVDAVQLDLAENGVRQQAAFAVEHGGGAFITGGFEGEDFHGWQV